MSTHESRKEGGGGPVPQVVAEVVLYHVGRESQVWLLESRLVAHLFLRKGLFYLTATEAARSFLVKERSVDPGASLLRAVSRIPPCLETGAYPVICTFKTGGLLRRAVYKAGRGTQLAFPFHAVKAFDGEGRVSKQFLPLGVFVRGFGGCTTGSFRGCTRQFLRSWPWRYRRRI